MCPTAIDSPAPLTKENLRLLDALTGAKKAPDAKAAATSTISKDEASSKAKTTSTTPQSGFGEKMCANGLIRPMDSSFHPPPPQTSASCTTS